MAVAAYLNYENSCIMPSPEFAVWHTERGAFVATCLDQTSQDLPSTLDPYATGMQGI